MSIVYSLKLEPFRAPGHGVSSKIPTVQWAGQSKACPDRSQMARRIAILMANTGLFLRLLVSVLLSSCVQLSTRAKLALAVVGIHFEMKARGRCQNQHRWSFLSACAGGVWFSRRFTTSVGFKKPSLCHGSLAASLSLP